MDKPKVPVWFIKEMNKQLVKSSDKGSWLKEEPDYLIASAYANIISGKNLRNKGLPKELVIKQFADAANYCMMVADIYRKNNVKP